MQLSDNLAKELRSENKTTLNSSQKEEEDQISRKRANQISDQLASVLITPQTVDPTTKKGNNPPENIFANRFGIEENQTILKGTQIGSKSSRY